MLVESGNIAPGYVESMLGREKQANTFLGNGIAIPHGMGKDRELIKQTGVSVVQFPDGVEWNPGQTVRIVVGIAAKSDEHLSILAALTDVLDDTATADRLAHTDDPAEIIAGLSRRAPIGGSRARRQLAGAQLIDVTLRPGAGLHARPATFFVDVANGFQSEIRVEFRGKIANGKAMASLLKLGAEGGATLRLSARGPDADAALEALEGSHRERTRRRGGKGSPSSRRAPGCRNRADAPSPASPRRPGSPSAGCIISSADHIVVKDTPGDPDIEWQKLRDAIENARGQLQDVYDAMKARVGKNEAAIFRAHQAFLADAELFGEATALIEAGPQRRVVVAAGHRRTAWPK